MGSSCQTQGKTEAPPWPGSTIPAGSFCRQQIPDSFDDLGKIRAAMRQAECLLVLYENRPELDPRTLPRLYKLYGQIVDKLARKNKWDSHAPAWERLYLITSRMNRIQNELARNYRIPVFTVIGHHMATALWVEVARRRPSSTLLHFDSHSDTRGLRNPERILKLGREILTGRHYRRAVDKLSQYLNDPATPSSAGILILGFKNFVWAKPSWYNLKNVVRRSFFYGKLVKPNAGETAPSKKWDLFYDKSADTATGEPVERDSSWIRLTKPASQMGQWAHVRRLWISVFTTSPWPTENDKDQMLKKDLLLAVPKGPFVLDIDIDYFGTVDLTPGLQRTAPPSKYEGRSEYLKSHNVKAREEKYRRHREHIDARMKEFEAMLRYLRDHERIPTSVTVVDSTYMPFAVNWWAEEFWEYTPTRFVPYIQLQVRRVLAHLYGAYNAGPPP